MQRSLAELAEKLEILAAAGYAVAVIDTPPAITDAIQAVVTTATLVIIPTRPSPHDLRAVGSTVELAQHAREPFVFAVTQAKPNTRLTVQRSPRYPRTASSLVRSCMIGLTMPAP